jgi:hypothetical protein
VVAGRVLGPAADVDDHPFDGIDPAVGEADARRDALSGLQDPIREELEAPGGNVDGRALDPAPVGAGNLDGNAVI